MLCLLATLGAIACGDEAGDDAAAAFDPEGGLEPVVECLADQGWTESGSLSSGSAYTVTAESGASVLLSVNEPEVEPVGDETTFTVPASDPAEGSLGVENITGTITDDERAQVESCAAG
jgi:hypothetical protein